MADFNPELKKVTLDKDLDKIVHVEAAVTTVARGLAGPGLGLLFLILAAIFAAVYVAGEPRAFIIVLAAGIGAYMALNIGAKRCRQQCRSGCRLQGVDAWRCADHRRGV